MPWLIVRKGYMARKRVFAGFIEYTEKKHDVSAVQLIKNRVDINTRYGISKKMDGMLESSMAFGLLTSTIPAAFWMVSYIFADKNLLVDIRREIDGCTREGEDKKHLFINATKLKTNCPLLASVFRETLRMTASGVHCQSIDC